MDSSFCSNLARKEATPLGEIPADILKHQAVLANAMLVSMIVGSEKEQGMVRQSCMRTKCRRVWNIC